MDDNDTTPTTVGPSRLNWADIGVTLVLIAQGIADAYSSGLEYLGACLGSHSMHIGEKQAFNTNAGRDIERITNGE